MAVCLGVSATGLLLVINNDTNSKTEKHRLAFSVNFAQGQAAHAHGHIHGYVSSKPRAPSGMNMTWA